MHAAWLNVVRYDIRKRIQDLLSRSVATEQTTVFDASYEFNGTAVLAARSVTLCVRGSQEHKAFLVRRQMKFSPSSMTDLVVMCLRTFHQISNHYTTSPIPEALREAFRIQHLHAQDSPRRITDIRALPKASVTGLDDLSYSLDLASRSRARFDRDEPFLPSQCHSCGIGWPKFC